MAYTIATHLGTKVHRAHNIRAKSCVEKEEHITPAGELRPDGRTAENETWTDMTEAQAYHRIFDKYVKQFNDKQKRADRKIKNYLADVKKDSRRHSAYEMIVGVYSDKHSELDAATQKEILQEYVRTFSERNPQIYIFGAYYHDDEPGQPHIHLDFIPVAEGYKRGMERQVSLSKCIEQQGIERLHPKETFQMAFERTENKALEEICNKYNLEISHPIAEGREKKRQHESTQEYKIRKKMEQLEQEHAEKSAQEAQFDILIAQKGKYLAELEKKANKASDEVKTITKIEDAIQRQGAIMTLANKKDKKRIKELEQQLEKTTQERDFYEKKFGELHEILTETNEILQEEYNTDISELIQNSYKDR